MPVKRRWVKSIGLTVGQQYSWALGARVVYSQPGCSDTMSVATRPGARCQRGRRSARQPRISGRAARCHDIMVIITLAGIKLLQKGVYEAILVGQNVQPSMAPIKVYLEAEDLVEAMAWSGSTPQALAGLLVPSISHGQSSCWSRRWLLLRPGYMKSQYEYNDVLASNVTTSYKQSSNHASLA